MENVLAFIVEHWEAVSSFVLIVIMFASGKMKLTQAIIRVIHIVEEASLQKFRADGKLPDSATKKEAAKRIWNSVLPKVVKPLLNIPGIKGLVNKYVDASIDKVIKDQKGLRESLKSFIGF